ncbi:methyltransferase family protein [Prauserella shujinwangii]|uniref:Methyltransferase family protein n=1 Tax=Prauserella shujinwangii TaxID=1453103 RepID=A0A2T0LKM3_9PSEU|nr:class I SAM-dependent methyltransferase [Prauserella shujinwangii]PRX43460.1 methyltransferase family protein [Prauserella shujinwangii]
MTDVAYTDPELAALYDALNPWGPGDDFYLGLVLSATAVLDLGCGTGALLRAARERGHPGRLCGVDPAPAMLDVARARADVEWVLGDARSLGAVGEFDLVVMTGHAFQVLTGDDEIRASLAAVRAALTEHGRFAFETRNPAVRPWERWHPGHATGVTTAAGIPVRVEHEVRSVDGDLVTFTETFSAPGWPRPRVSRSTLRFPGAAAVSGFLAGAGLAVEQRFGDWARRPFSPASPEIVTVARRDPATTAA